MEPAERVRRDARITAAWTLFATAVLATYVARFKQGPDEFFPVVTAWKIADPMAQLVPDLAVLMMALGSLALLAQSTGLARTRRVLAAAAFPAAIAAIAVLPNAPPAFAFAASIVLALSSLAVLIA
ncbi:MAG TPA: hypothetical protein VLC10_03285 [Patescibacteria group bacterium]|nr:hypothetical protein [Patescibacteria group bacterium]